MSEGNIDDQGQGPPLKEALNHRVAFPVQPHACYRPSPSHWPTTCISPASPPVLSRTQLAGVSQLAPVPLCQSRGFPLRGKIKSTKSVCYAATTESCAATCEDHGEHHARTVKTLKLKFQATFSVPILGPVTLEEETLGLLKG